MSDDFEVLFGRIGHSKGGRQKSYVRQVMEIAFKNGLRSKSKSSFNGRRIGRGGVIGALAVGSEARSGKRRAVIKVRIAKLKAGNLSAARAHMRYIQRDGVTLDGEPGQLYSNDSDTVDGPAFVENCAGDRHQFRMIVSADDGAELGDPKPFIRDLMQRMELDLGTQLNWVAVDHFNTGHPHTHVVIKGKTDDRKDLIIARDYITHGIRQQACELLTRELGPEDEFQQRLKLLRQVEQDRFTNLDRSLLKQAEQGILVMSAIPLSDSISHSTRVLRLRHLQNLGLAEEIQTGVWQIDENMEPKLRALGQRIDITKTMHRAMREAGIDRPSGNFAIHDATKSSTRLVGRVAALGLTDELTDRTYAVIDSLDGRVVYVDLGNRRPDMLPQKGMIVSLESQAAADSKPKSMQLTVLSYLNLEQLTDAQGATWLDRELVKPVASEGRDQGFGAEVNKALTQRRQWLISQALGKVLDDGTFHPAPNMLTELKQRDIQRAIIQLAKELQLDPNITTQGEQLSGTYRQAVNLASGKYAIIQKSKEFTLVPWRPELEKFRGQDIAGTIGIHDRFESIGRRTRGLEI